MGWNGYRDRSARRSFGSKPCGFVREQELTISEAARRLPMSEKTLANWVFRARQGQLAGLGETRRSVTDLEAEVARLKRELAEARMERDILKKTPWEFNRSVQHSPVVVPLGSRIPRSFGAAGSTGVPPPIELGLRMCREIRALREVLPKESVCVFVGAALPRASGITEIHLGVRRQGEGFGVGEFHATIPGQ